MKAAVPGLALAISLFVPVATVANVPRCNYTGIPRDVSDFLGRYAACSIETDIAPVLKVSKAKDHSRFRCDALASDRISLKRRYHDNPRVLDILEHRHYTLSVGFLGIERYPAEARIVELHIFPNGYVQFDAEPEIPLSNLPEQIKTLMRENPRPDIRLMPERRTPYAEVVQVLSTFQRMGYGGHFGFTGIEAPN